MESLNVKEWIDTAEVFKNRIILYFSTPLRQYVETYFHREIRVDFVCWGMTSVYVIQSTEVSAILR